MESTGIYFECMCHFDTHPVSESSLKMNAFKGFSSGYLNQLTIPTRYNINWYKKKRRACKWKYQIILFFNDNHIHTCTIYNRQKQNVFKHNEWLGKDRSMHPYTSDEVDSFVFFSLLYSFRCNKSMISVHT